MPRSQWRSTSRDDATNAKLKADRGIGFEDVIFHIERGDFCSTPTGTPARALSSSEHLVLVLDERHQVTLPSR